MSEFTQFTKRTNFPKLGYIIDTLIKRGIACRLHGNSYHAPILEVETKFSDRAWALLSESAKSHGIRTTPGVDLDTVDDDHPFFMRYQPEHIITESEE